MCLWLVCLCFYTLEDLNILSLYLLSIHRSVIFHRLRLYWFLVCVDVVLEFDFLIVSVMVFCIGKLKEMGFRVV
jgi:hypothetical protein